ncbi:DUF2922 domain-containing protein [Levilactobacillus acidifarinae]|uniref:DUF2922 domain-containing protein n=1 Tax=Levilactobacillus acidifarinae DSM 19394 = JCM 15949 TaxID=1423715 RepID=A0A0R1LGF3_9LACO|nr:DUF2922 domain-containing protein [Levilactobacillus acidifarinae]KRK94950.1 hypothetical protein FD25_GL002135 [Levilactobacillus acidifarinae DSM 19394]GEO70123.1 hypothetical protein LAC03_20330 [Levilactobacillus acidifarinae]
MKTLELSFKGTDHRIKNLRLKYVNADLTAEEAEAVMLKMAASKLFVKQDVELYATPVSATVVETTKTPLPGGAA